MLGRKVLVLLLLPAALGAQGFRFAPFVQPEVRANFVAARESMVLAGIGANIPAGYYTRIAVSAEGGATLGARSEPAGRAEVVARFLADPFHQSVWGAYGGGGIAFVARQGARGRAALMLVMGVEFPGARGWRPAIELGAGAGVRLGLTLKPPRRTGR